MSFAVLQLIISNYFPDTSRKYGAEIGQDFPPPYPGGEQVTRVTPSYQGEKQGTTIPYTPGELPYGTNFATYTSETPQVNFLSLLSLRFHLQEN